MSEADAAEADAYVAGMPEATTLGISPAEGFSAAYDAMKRNEAGDAQFRNVESAVQDHLDYVKSITGDTYDNPIPRGPTAIANTTQGLLELSQKRNDPSLAMPDIDELNQRGLEKARASATLADQMPGLMSSGKAPYQFGAGLAGFAGRLAAGFTDPEAFAANVGSLALIPEGGPAARALMTAAGFGAGQLATTLSTEAYRREITPERGFGDAAKEVAAAAALGAGTSLAGAGFAALWRRLRTEAPTVAATVPQSLQDAGNVAERAADLEANNPFRTGLSGVQAHHDAITSISRDLAEGRDPALPGHVEEEARLAQPGPGLGDVMDRAAASEHPEIQRIAAAVNEAMPEWQTMRDKVAAGDVLPMQDVTPAVSQAMDAVMTSVESGQPISDVLTKGDTFYSDAAQQATRLFYKDGDLGSKIASQKEIADNLSSFAKTTAGEPVEAAAARPSIEARLPRMTEEDLEKLRADPALQDAMIADLQRDIDRGEAQIGFEDGKPVLADPEFHAAEQQEMLARELGNCIAGAPAE